MHQARLDSLNISLKCLGEGANSHLRIFFKNKSDYFINLKKLKCHPDSDGGFVLKGANSPLRHLRDKQHLFKKRTS